MTKKHGWTKDVLINHIENKSYEKYLLNQTNFDDTLPEKMKDLLPSPEEIEKRLIDINVKINLTDNAKNYFIDNGYDEYYGARPLKRLVNNKLETLIAKKLINNEIKPNTTVNVDYINNELKVS